jgi:DNA-binding response OmpR family regulator
MQLADGGREELSKLEVDVLRYLARSGDRIVSRDELLARVWGQKPHLIATRSVDMTIARLRRKLGGREVLVTVRGKGYRLNP